MGTYFIKDGTIDTIDSTWLESFVIDFEQYELQLNRFYEEVDC